MTKLKGSQAEQNIITAFASESQARNRYTYFASKAKKDGYASQYTFPESVLNSSGDDLRLCEVRGMLI